MSEENLFENVLDRFKKRMLDFLRFLEAFKLSNSEVSKGVWIKPNHSDLR